MLARHLRPVRNGILRAVTWFVVLGVLGLLAFLVLKVIVLALDHGPSLIVSAF